MISQFGSEKFKALLIGVRERCGKILSNPRGRLVSAFIVASASIILIASTLPVPSTLLSLVAETETIDVKIVNPDASIIAMSGGYDENAETCFERLEVKPSMGATVSYSRIANGSLYIAISGGASISSSEGVARFEQTLARFVISDKTLDCNNPSQIRLPVSGLVSSGNESLHSIDITTAVLRGGEVSVFSRSVGSLFGVIPLNWGPFEPDALFLVEVLTLPSGSRLTDARTSSGSPARWWGYADVDFSSTRLPAIQLRAATNARTVKLFAPAPRELSIHAANVDQPSAQQPDVIAFSFGARLSNDPNLRWLYGIIASMALFATTLEASASFARLREHPGTRTNGQGIKKQPRSSLRRHKLTQAKAKHRRS
ncbi:MAG TPA: hypothetical protein EYN14_17140 [Alphaproteobacteria bacterium]|jgi:hypothetical protein|nr:hypothetical protein [Alphaproteobacteria bacterium]